MSLPPNLGEPTLDLHGLRLREALQRTDAFLRREQAQGTVAVRIITGHGGGILKQAIGDLLAQHPSVARVTTALQALRSSALAPAMQVNCWSPRGKTSTGSIVRQPSPTCAAPRQFQRRPAKRLVIG